MKKAISVFLIIISLVFCFACSQIGDELKNAYALIERDNNYTVTIHTLVENSARYTETIYVFDGNKEYEKTPASEHIYVDDGTITSIYDLINDEWVLSATVNSFSLVGFAEFLRPFFTADNYRYDRKAKIYVMQPSAYSEIDTTRVENVWCEFEGEDILIYYNEQIDGQTVITDVRISKIGSSEVLLN